MTSLCFPFNLWLTGDGVGDESDWDGEGSMSFGDLVSAKLGGTVNYNLKHVNQTHGAGTVGLRNGQRLELLRGRLAI